MLFIKMIGCWWEPHITHLWGVCHQTKESSLPETYICRSKNNVTIAISMSKLLLNNFYPYLQIIALGCVAALSSICNVAIISSRYVACKLSIFVTLQSRIIIHHNHPFPTFRSICIIILVVSTDMVLMYLNM